MTYLLLAVALLAQVPAADTDGGRPEGWPMTLDIACQILNHERHGHNLLWFPARDARGRGVALGMERLRMWGPAPIPGDEAIRMAEEYQRTYAERNP